MDKSKYVKHMSVLIQNLGQEFFGSQISSSRVCSQYILFSVSISNMTGLSSQGLVEKILHGDSTHPDTF